MNATALDHDIEVAPDEAHGPVDEPTVRADACAFDWGVDADEVDLTLRRPLAELPDSTRIAVTGWLIGHHIEPSRVAIDSPVRRNEASSSVSWREEREGGVVVRHFFPAVDPRDGWPAPFPREILQPQVRAVV